MEENADIICSASLTQFDFVIVFYLPQFYPISYLNLEVETQLAQFLSLALKQQGWILSGSSGLRESFHPAKAGMEKRPDVDLVCMAEDTEELSTWNEIPPTLMQMLWVLCSSNKNEILRFLKSLGHVNIMSPVYKPKFQTLV